jgi:peptidoglycan/LPS O-acetylase OafA/YrhL
VSLIAFASLWIIESLDVFSALPRFIRFGIPAFIFFVTIVKSTQEQNMPNLLVLFGDISFSFYLMHMDVLAVIKGIMIKTGIITDYVAFKANGFIIEKLVSTGIGLILSIGVSAITYILIEKKFTGFLRRKLLHS